MVIRDKNQSVVPIAPGSSISFAKRDMSFRAILRGDNAWQPLPLLDWPTAWLKRREKTERRLKPTL